MKRILSGYEQVLEQGLSQNEYVELVGVIVKTVTVDMFCRGLGVPVHPLPEPVAG